MAFTWLVPQPRQSFFGNERFDKKISAQRVIAILHALEYLVHNKHHDALKDIKSLDNQNALSEDTKALLGEDLERAFRIIPGRQISRRVGALDVIREVLSEQDGSFGVVRGDYQSQLMRAFHLAGRAGEATELMKHLGLVRADHEDLFMEIRQSRDFAIPDEPCFNTFFGLLASGRLTNEKGFSARSAELIVYGSRIEDGQPYIGMDT